MKAGNSEEAAEKFEAHEVLKKRKHFHYIKVQGEEASAGVWNLENAS